MKFKEKQSAETLEKIKESLQICFDSEGCIILLAAQDDNGINSFRTHRVRFGVSRTEHLHLLEREMKDIFSEYEEFKKRKNLN